MDRVMASNTLVVVLGRFKIWGRVVNRIVGDTIINIFWLDNVGRKEALIFCLKNGNSPVSGAHIRFGKLFP